MTAQAGPSECKPDPLERFKTARILRGELFSSHAPSKHGAKPPNRGPSFPNLLALPKKLEKLSELRGRRDSRSDSQTRLNASHSSQDYPREISSPAFALVERQGPKRLRSDSEKPVRCPGRQDSPKHKLTQNVYRRKPKWIIVT